jgi:hypothetical protein
MDGYIGQTRQIRYPDTWLSVRRETNSLQTEESCFRNLYVIPNIGSGNAEVNGVYYNTLFPNMIAGYQNIFVPNYWEITYTTGFNKIPQDLLDLIAKLSSIELLLQLGDLIGPMGQSSVSLSLDGLSQNSSYMKSQQGGVFQGRISNYLKDLETLMPVLRGKYQGFIFEVV